MDPNERNQQMGNQKGKRREIQLSLGNVPIESSILRKRLYGMLKKGFTSLPRHDLATRGAEGGKPNRSLRCHLSSDINSDV
jgi:hypothetical protein